MWQSTITRHKNICRQHNLKNTFIHPTVMRKLTEELAKPHHIPTDPAHWGHPRCLEAGQHDTHPQKEPEGRSGKLQACQAQLGAWQGYGTDHLECHHTAPPG